MRLKDHNIITRLLRTRPLFCAAVLFTAGCIAGYYLNFPYVVLLIFAAALCFCLFLFHKSRRMCAMLLVLMMLPLGAFRFETAWNAVSPLEDQPVAMLSGRICKTPQWRSDTERTVCVLDDVSIDGISLNRRIRLYLRGDTELLQKVELAQRICCTAHIWRADEATNPYQFNFSDYLRVRGLSGYATAKIEEAELSLPDYGFIDLPERLREAIAARIDRVFPENSAIVKAFIIGDRSDMDEEDRASFNRAGAAHLLAVSGMHISMLAGFVYYLLGKLLNRKTSFLITLAVLMLYGLITAFPPSLLRALIMFAVFGSAPLFGRFSDPPTRLASALLLQLIIAPADILSSGFVLSYGASAGIIFLSLPLQHLTHTNAFFQRRPVYGLRGLFTRRIPQWIIRSVISTCAAQLAIYPAVIHYFGSQSLWSFLTNLAAVPLAMSAFIASVIGAITAFSPIVRLSDLLFGWLYAFVRFMAGLPLSAVHTARFPMWLTLLFVLVCFASSELSRIPSKIRRFLPLFIIPAVILSDISASLTTRRCSIVFMDAGQADCAMIRTDGHVYLVDTGDSYSPAADYISAMNYHIDGIFLSHPHDDHCGGLESILDCTVPDVIYISSNWNSLEADEGIPEAIARAVSLGSQIRYVSEGDSFALSSETNMKVLAPAEGFPASSANNDSLILHLKYGACSALFTGDMPADAMSDTLPDTDILKVSHHGAGDGTDARLLYAATPSLSIIPVGYNNYGHPESGTLELLEAAGSRILRTDYSGAVTCVLSRDGRIEYQTFNSPEAVHELG